jgi:hypothetical protein
MEPKAIDLKNTRIFVYDGSTVPKYLELKIDEGNIQWTVARNIEVKKNKGLLDYLKEGDEEAVKLQLECRFSALKSSIGDPKTAFEIFTNSNDFYTSVADCKPYQVHIELLVDNITLCGTTVENELIRFEYFAYEEISASFKDGTLSISGVCNVVSPNAQRGT